MASTKSTSRLAMFFALALAMAVLASAQNTPQDFVNLHNSARAVERVGQVTWDNTVAAFAQNYAATRKADCLVQHSPTPRRFGENIFGGTGQSWTAASAVNSWVAEKQNYHLNTNTCDAGKVCGHYTQVVWRKSVRIGCARVVCDANRGIFIICSYDPPGNFNGERPFDILDAEAK